MHPQQLPTVTVDELPAGVVLLDVREDEEWRAGHIAGAVHVPMSELPNRLAYDGAPITADTPVVVVCKMGGRSAHVAAWLLHNGFKATNLDGGMLAWATAHRPMVSESAQVPYVA